jgi:hypothetical protein
MPMPGILIVAASFLAVLGVTSAALANGAVSEFPAGGVVFKPEKDISIVSEELEIGWNAIHVRYVFESYAPTPIERTIGFPMAEVSLADGPDNVIDRSWRQEQEADPRNYMAFEVSVNGKSVRPMLHEYAWFNGTNITGKLLEMGIPLFAADTETFTKLAQLPEATIRTLKREKLVQKTILTIGWFRDGNIRWSMNGRRLSRRAKRWSRFPTSRFSAPAITIIVITRAAKALPRIASAR